MKERDSKNISGLCNDPILITEQDWNDNVIPFVSINCITYNHEKYIKETIEGFLRQKTTFPIEILIHDDASTDKTAEIIREYGSKYPSLIKPIYQTENQYSKRDGTIGRIQRNRAKGKYYTVCEGDDYWADPLKLQKQIEYMESHPECGITATSAYILNDKTRKLKSLPLSNAEYRFEDFVLGNRISNLTSCTRTDLIRQYVAEIKPERRSWKSGDYPMWLYLSKVSTIKCLPFRSAVYRVLEESASHSKDSKKLLDFSRYHHSLRKFYLDYFHASDELYHKVELISYRESSTLAIITKDYLLYDEIYNFYISNGYNGLAQFLKFKKKFPGMIKFLDLFEKVLIKIGIIKFDIKL
ncbi:MAG: glycosyltransferase [Proteiniphilum sp.]|uniref:glycosyltransferase family 2 protein n=1 Tax=Proteiniphilum sp. TaxID=1926877 RepID=UPI002B20BE89|nr:glycosyltransferase [Proteiniphilum sp.]MEA5127276.1 glycosyltransferase [Proteiniphilum sp.]